MPKGTKHTKKKDYIRKAQIRASMPINKNEQRYLTIEACEMFQQLVERYIDKIWEYAIEEATSQSRMEGVYPKRMLIKPEHIKEAAGAISVDKNVLRDELYTEIYQEVLTKLRQNVSQTFSERADQLAELQNGIKDDILYMRF